MFSPFLPILSCFSLALFSNYALLLKFMLSIHNTSRFSQALFSVMSTFMHWMSYWKISTHILILFHITSSLKSFVWTWSLITILDTAASFNTKSSHSSKNIWPCPLLTSGNFTKRDEIDSVFEAFQCLISMTSSLQNSILFANFWNPKSSSLSWNVVPKKVCKSFQCLI